MIILESFEFSNGVVTINATKNGKKFVIKFEAEEVEDNRYRTTPRGAVELMKLADGEPKVIVLQPYIIEKYDCIEVIKNAITKEPLIIELTLPWNDYGIIFHIIN